MVGLNGDKGMGWEANTTPLMDLTNAGQLETAYNQSQQGIGQQQEFLKALQAQGGIGNQSNVFNQQQALADQLQGVANGTGPNPAQAMLAQATGANVANQAALMAGQRGASNNVGMIARQAGMQGGNLQQQAAGQGATMQANQSLNALGALQGQQANMANLATTQVGQQAGALTGYNNAVQGQQNALLNAGSAQNNAHVALQNGINGANGSLQGINAGIEGKTLGGLVNGGASAAMMLSDERLKTNVSPADPEKFMDSIKGYEYDYKDPANGPGKQMGVMAQDVEKTAPQLVEETGEGKAIDYNKAGGPIFAALANLNERLKKYEGAGVKEEPKKMAQGGPVLGAQTQMPQVQVPAWVQQQNAAPATMVAPKRPMIADILNQGSSNSNPMAMDQKDPNVAGGEALGKGLFTAGQALFGGSNSPTADAMQMPEMGSSLNTPVAPSMGGGSFADAGIGSSLSGMFMAQGGAVTGPMLASKGKEVPGKAKVKGDSLKNDVVDAKLSPGEIVIPRSITQGENAAQEAAKFVAAILSRKGKLK